MSYVIACWKDGLPYGIKVGKEAFQLIPIDSPKNVSRLFNTPYCSAMQKFLTWIEENDDQLKHEDLSIQDYGRFYR